VPCGISDKRATSVERLLGRRVEMADATPRLVEHLCECFGREMRAASVEELQRALAAAEAQAPAQVAVA
jgi:lipoate-protein ligase B